MCSRCVTVMIAGGVARESRYGGVMDRAPPPGPHPCEATLDPDVLAAKSDVDLTLLHESLAMSPGDRLDASYRFLRSLLSFRPSDEAPEHR